MNHSWIENLLSIPTHPQTQTHLVWWISPPNFALPNTVTIVLFTTKKCPSKLWSPPNFSPSEISPPNVFPTKIFTTEFLFHQTVPIFVYNTIYVQYKWKLNHEQLLLLARLLLASRIFFLVPHMTMWAIRKITKFASKKSLHIMCPGVWMIISLVRAGQDDNSIWCTARVVPNLCKVLEKTQKPKQNIKIKNSKKNHQKPKNVKRKVDYAREAQQTNLIQEGGKWKISP